MNRTDRVPPPRRRLGFEPSKGHACSYKLVFTVSVDPTSNRQGRLGLCMPSAPPRLSSPGSPTFGPSPPLPLLTSLPVAERPHWAWRHRHAWNLALQSSCMAPSRSVARRGKASVAAARGSAPSPANKRPKAQIIPSYSTDFPHVLVLTESSAYLSTHAIASTSPNLALSGFSFFDTVCAPLKASR